VGVGLSGPGAGVEARSETPTPPRWDRNRVLFEIVEDGQVLSCAISKEALQDISDRRYAKPAELLTCFEKVRDRVEQVARAKFRVRPDSIDGLVTIWSGDLDEPEPAESS
jgi:hypothetical protein